MSNDKLLSFLGLCRRAGKMTIGNAAVAEEINNGESCLVLLASDISPRTEKEICEKAVQGNVKIIKLLQEKQQISSALGKLAAVISINDTGFAEKIVKLTGNE